MAAPSYARVGTVAAASGASSLSPALPSGWVAGNYWLLIVQYNTGGTGVTVSTPSGWTLLMGRSSSYSSPNTYMYVFARKAQTGDTAPTVTLSAGVGGCEAVIIEYTGVDGTTPTDGTANAEIKAASTAPNVATYTTSAASDLVVQILGTAADNIATSTPPTNYSAYRLNDYQSGAAGLFLAIVDQAFATAQTIPVEHWNRFGNFQNSLSVAVALAAATPVDAATVTTSTTVSSSETVDYIDSATVSTKTTVSSTEIYNILTADLATVPTTTAVSSGEIYTPANIYTDSATISTSTKPTSSDIYATNNDSAIVKFTTKITSIESMNHPSGSWGPFDDDDGIFVWP